MDLLQNNIQASVLGGLAAKGSHKILTERINYRPLAKCYFARGLRHLFAVKL